MDFVNKFSTISYPNIFIIKENRSLTRVVFDLFFFFLAILIIATVVQKKHKQDLVITSVGYELD